MQGNAGPCAWALRSKELAPEVERFKKAGILVTEPTRSGRERPDGVRLDWETTNIGAEPNGTFFPFLIHDLTPRERRAYPSGKPTTQDFSGISRVVIAVRDPQAAVARYRKTYGLPAPEEQDDASFGAHLAAFKGTPVVLAAPLTAQSWLGTRVDEFGEGPCAFILRSRNAGQYQAAAKSRWFGVEISWLDATKLGWRLGWE
jgi:hypothetical protein